jgi:hypothetical protein
MAVLIFIVMFVTHVLYVQIVENRNTRLSRPFLGHGDNHSPPTKSYDENHICHTILLVIRIKKK